MITATAILRPHRHRAVHGPFLGAHRFSSDSTMPSVHVPVMLREVLRGLDLLPGLTVVDGTIGGGGHSAEILTKIRPGGYLLGLDRDPMMLELAGQKVSGPDVFLRQASYAELPRVMRELGWTAVDRILVDLGLSSDQLAEDARGFGFHSTSELDLRFDPTQGQSAADLLATASVNELEHVFEAYGELPRSRRLAEQIVNQRTTQPLRTAADLVATAFQIVPARPRGKKNPATLLFQALRIAVNQELDHVRQALTQVFADCLKPGGILAVITFHSLEDRIAKESLRNPAVWEMLTPKPIEPTPAEVRFNPRSRSAKLRLARRK